MHRVLIVDDSKVARLALRGIVERDAEGLRVVGMASSADEARQLATSLVPDLILMDVHLGSEDGVQLCSELLSVVRTRIVIVTGIAPRDPALLFRSMAAGALDVLAKPRGAAVGESERSSFARALRALAAVPLLKSWRGGSTSGASIQAPSSTTASRASVAPSMRSDVRQLRALLPIERVLIGVSTGGPPLLERILREAPPKLAVPVVVVQHIAAGFGEGFARWLSASTGHDVRYCRGAAALEPGVVYVANDSAHLHLVSPDFLRVGAARKPRVATPSVDELFESALPHDPARTLAILLTGMGNDGAQGLGMLRAAGATTVAQDPRSCVVGSMPESAIARGAAGQVLTPDRIASLLARLERPARANPEVG